MTQQPLRLPSNVPEVLAEEVRRYGNVGVETGALLLTAPGDLTVTTVALAGQQGIQRGLGLFVITLPAFDALFTYAENHELQVRAMVHSHPEEAFLSYVDRQQGLRMRGFISAVIPTYADPPPLPEHWGWWRYDKDWHPDEPARVAADIPPAEILIFDAGGVRGH